VPETANASDGWVCSWTCVATSLGTWQIGQKEERAMPTPADVRKMALSLPGVSEIDHERKEFLFAAHPKVFVKYMWGKRANVIVQIDKIGKRELEALIHESHAINSPSQSASKKARVKRKTR
jgi:hypothetical protein